MRSEEKLLVLLQGPSYYAHNSAKELKVLAMLSAKKRGKKTAFYKLANYHFDVIMDVFNMEERCRILKTWLTDYELPFDPAKFSSFDKFHETHNKWILYNGQNIESYHYES
jgi:hypothetical protein